jgi:hypothetical protein
MLDMLKDATDSGFVAEGIVKQTKENIMKTLIAIFCVLSCGVAYAGCPGGICNLNRFKSIAVEPCVTESYASSVPTTSYVEDATTSYVADTSVAPSNSYNVAYTNSNAVQTSNCCSTCDNVVVKNSVKSRRCRCRNRCR